MDYRDGFNLRSWGEQIDQNLRLEKFIEVKGALIEDCCSQYFWISGNLEKLSRSLIRNLSWGKSSGQMCSKQQDSSTRTKSAQVGYPSSQLLFPKNFSRYSNLGLNLSLQAASLALRPSATQRIFTTLSKHSLSTPLIFIITALCCGVLPNSSFLFDLSMMQWQIASVQVILTSPSIRQGRLGKLNPSLFLSPPNHCQGALYWTSSQTALVQASSNLGICPLPLIPQQPRVTLLLLLIQNILW